MRARIGIRDGLSKVLAIVFISPLFLSSKGLLLFLFLSTSTSVNTTPKAPILMCFKILSVFLQNAFNVFVFLTYINTISFSCLRITNQPSALTFRPNVMKRSDSLL